MSVEDLLDVGQGDDLMGELYGQTKEQTKQVAKSADEVASVVAKPVTTNAPALSAGNDVSELLGNDTVNVPAQTEAPKVEKTIYNKLDENDQKLAEKQSKQLNYAERITLTNYGQKAADSIDAFSKKYMEKGLDDSNRKSVSADLNMLANVIKSINLQEVADQVEREETQQEDRGGFFGLFKKKPSKLVPEKKQDIFKATSDRIDALKNKLGVDQQILVEDNKQLDAFYTENLNLFRVTNILIAGLEIYEEELVTKIIPELQEAKKDPTQDEAKIQEQLEVANKYVAAIDRRKYDFRVNRQMIIQRAPSIRLIEENNVNLAEKIQTTIMTTLPAWRTNFVVIMSTLRQKQVTETEKGISDLTNDLLVQGADALHQTSVETARENERAIVDIESLEYAQNKLIQTLDETMQIQEEGRRIRELSTQKLNEMEEKMKQKVKEYAEKGR